LSGSAAASSIETALARLRHAPTDQDAWADLYRLTWPFVLALCHRRLSPSRRVVDAEDLAQEVFLRFARYWHSRLPSIADADSLFPVLSLMVRRLSYDVARRRQAARRDVRREVAGADEQAIDGHDALAEADLCDLLDKVSAVMALRERQVLELRIEGFEVSDISEKLGLPIRTVERSLQQIRRVLGPRVGGDFD